MVEDKINDIILIILGVNIPSLRWLVWCQWPMGKKLVGPLLVKCLSPKQRTESDL